MHLRILGCHGGESPSHRPTCFLIDDSLLLDAGSLTRGLSVAEQAKIDDVVVSHSHLDHIQDPALLADNVIGLRQKPVTIWCTPTTADALEQHFFNDKLWPNFLRIPTPEAPVVRIQRINSGETVQIGEYKIRTVLVNHAIECHGMFVTGKTGTLVYSGDTGPTELLWQEINKLEDLRALICEVSFPNALEKIAQVSGHLTPKTLAIEIAKWRPKTKARLLLYGMKPAHHEVLKTEVAALGDPRMVMLRPMDEYEL